MTAISDWPEDLHGKKTVTRTATLEIALQFGLWADYSYWVPSNQQLELWHDLTVLQKENVTIEVALGNEVILKKVFTKFETVNLHYVFNDMEHEDCDLTIKIVNLTNLPIRDDTGIFVSGIVNIESIQLQGIEILQLLENTMFGNDTNEIIKIRKPIYSWMIKNHQKILPLSF